MGAQVNLGTIWARAVLDTSGISVGVAGATTQLTAFAGALQKQVSSPLNRLAQDAGRTMQVMGLGVAAGLAVAVKAGADFEKKLADVSGNTTMTTADVATMTAAIKKMGQESGAPLSQLADGWMHATNFGYQAADAHKILDAAMRSAVATGGNVEHTANILAGVMHGFGIETSKAAATMNTLHLAAALGNMTLEQFNEAAGPTLAYAAGLGLKVQDAAAAMSALTRHGFNASEAATQVRNAIAHIVNPSTQAKEALEALSKKSGVDLVADFTVAGLHAKGLSGVFEDLRQVSEKTGIALPEIIRHLIPAMRGGIGALVLASQAAHDYDDILGQLEKTQSGKLDPTTEKYNERLKTAANEMDRVRNEMVILSGDILRALAPGLATLVRHLTDAVHWFGALPDPVKSSAVQIAAVGAAALIAGGSILRLTARVIELRNALVAGGLASGLGNLASKAGALGVGAVGVAWTAMNGYPQDQLFIDQLNDYRAGKLRLDQVQDPDKIRMAAVKLDQEETHRQLQEYFASHPIMKPGLPKADPLAGGVKFDPKADKAASSAADDAREALKKRAAALREMRVEMLRDLHKDEQADIEEERANLQRYVDAGLTLPEAYRRIQSNIDRIRAEYKAKRDAAADEDIVSLKAAETAEAERTRASQAALVAQEKAWEAFRGHMTEIHRALGSGFELFGQAMDGVQERLWKTAAAVKEASAAVRDALASMGNGDLWRQATEASQASTNDSTGEGVPLGGQKSQDASPGGGGGGSRSRRHQVFRGWGVELGDSFAQAFSSSFGNSLNKQFDKLFGKGNPIGQALARTFQRFLDDSLDQVFQNMFKGLGNKPIAVGGGSFAPGIVEGDNPMGMPGLGGMGGIGGLLTLLLGGGAAGAKIPLSAKIGALGPAIGMAFGGPVGAAIGGLAGGAFAALGHVFGFDDPVNDRSARRWGVDFARLFSSGLGDGFRDSRVLAGAHGGTVVHAPIVVHATIHHPMDIDTLTDRIAFNTRQRMRVRVGS